MASGDMRKSAGRHPGKQRLRQQRNVLAALAQGWELDGEGVEPEIEVLAEFALGHEPAHGLVGGRDQPEIGLAQFGAANPAVGSRLKQPQELHLHGVGDVAHLVQEQRAAAGRLHEPIPPGRGAGEGPALVAEQLAFEQRLRHARAIEHHEGRPRTGAGIVDGLGHQFLAGSGFALQEHGCVGLGNAGHEIKHLLEGGRAPDQPLRMREALGARASPQAFRRNALFRPCAFLTGERSMLS